jgi:hypothetical protein
MTTTTRKWFPAFVFIRDREAERAEGMAVAGVLIVGSIPARRGLRRKDKRMVDEAVLYVSRTAAGNDGAETILLWPYEAPASECDRDFDTGPDMEAWAKRSLKIGVRVPRVEVGLDEFDRMLLQRANARDEVLALAAKGRLH